MGLGYININGKYVVLSKVQLICEYDIDGITWLVSIEDEFGTQIGCARYTDKCSEIAQKHFQIIINKLYGGEVLETADLDNIGLQGIVGNDVIW